MVNVLLVPILRRVLGLALLGALAMTAGCGKVQGAPSAPQRPPASVTVFTAVQEDVPIYLDQIGKSMAPEVVSLQPQVSGEIVRIHFTDGASLKRGDPLFTIDPRPYQAQLDSAQASLAQNQASLELAKIEFARVERLLRAAAITKQEFDSKRNTLQVAQAQVQSSQAAIKTAKLNLEHCYIRSPIDGRAGQRLVDLGNVVNATGNGGNGTLLVIQRLDPIYANFSIPENSLSSVQRSLGAGTAKAQVRLPEDPDGGREAALTFLDNAVDGTGTVKLRATLPNADQHFWPGRFVKVRLILGTQPGAVLVPAAAPQISAKGPFVYVVKEDSTAELRPVTVGQQQADQVVITNGLKGGERVVVAGQMAVMPGGKVQIQDSGSQKISSAGVPGAGGAGGNQP